MQSMQQSNPELEQEKLARLMNKIAFELGASKIRALEAEVLLDMQLAAQNKADNEKA